ncbi:hypothetical protein ASE95_14500 [Sphingomonas sp. Leaf231]|nr:hypothetical protein [Sphingomonas sp. Leaf231]KQN89946.1 hypothetical protein ASE95_14500 [Sphingomonas sp. Leaf231]
MATARSCNAVSVEPGGDLDGGGAGGELAEDPSNDDRLLFIDSEQSADEFALCIEPDDALVTIGTTAGEAPGEYRRLHAAYGLFDKVLEEDCAQQACHGKLDLVDMTLRNRVERDTVVHQLLAQERDVLRVARQAIERFAHHHVDSARLDVAQQPL